MRIQPLAAYHAPQNYPTITFGRMVRGSPASQPTICPRSGLPNKLPWEVIEDLYVLSKMHVEGLDSKEKLQLLIPTPTYYPSQNGH